MDDLEEGDGDGPHLHPEQLRKGSQLPVINKEMLKNLNRFDSIDVTENCSKCSCDIMGTFANNRQNKKEKITKWKIYYTWQVSA